MTWERLSAIMIDGHVSSVDTETDTAETCDGDEPMDIWNRGPTVAKETSAEEELAWDGGVESRFVDRLTWILSISRCRFHENVVLDGRQETGE